MKRRDNPFPGVSRVYDRHGQVRFRFRQTKAGVKSDTYLPGPYGSVDFRAAYDAAKDGAKTPARAAAAYGTFAWLIEHYFGSLRFKDLAPAGKRSLRFELAWIKGQIGDLPVKLFEVQHVEALMGRKAGPTAANRVKKNLSRLFNYAIRLKLGVVENPAKLADRRKENPDGYHTWTEEEIARFLARHPSGSKARLCLLLALNTGQSRQDLCRSGWQDVSKWDTRKPRIAYRRGKGGMGADLPITPELAYELTDLPRDRLLFLTHGADGRPYKPETLANWFKDRCKEAGVPGSLHGLRKAGATRLADAGATEHEIMAFLAHATPKQGAVYTQKANRTRLADSGLAKLREAGTRRNVSTLRRKLDKGGDK